MSTLLFFSFLNRLLRARWMRVICTYLGQISYPTYLSISSSCIHLARLLPRTTALAFPLLRRRRRAVQTMFFLRLREADPRQPARYPRAASTGPAAIHDPGAGRNGVERRAAPIDPGTSNGLSRARGRAQSIKKADSGEGMNT